MRAIRFMVYSLWFIGSFVCSAMGFDRVSCNLRVEVLPDRSRFLLIAKNNLDTEVILQFPTSQKYDFIVKKADGKIIWQWSKGMMFSQMLTTLIFNPNEEKIFTEEYSLPPGEYTVQGILTTTPEKIYSEWVEFTVTQTQMPKIRGRVTKILDKLYLLGEDGTAYLIENPQESLLWLEGKRIEVTTYHIEPIPGTVDKGIIIKEYREMSRF